MLAIDICSNLSINDHTLCIPLWNNDSLMKQFFFTILKFLTKIYQKKVEMIYKAKDLPPRTCNGIISHVAFFVFIKRGVGCCWQVQDANIYMP